MFSLDLHPEQSKKLATYRQILLYQVQHITHRENNAPNPVKSLISEDGYTDLNFMAIQAVPLQLTAIT